MQISAAAITSEERRADLWSASKMLALQLELRYRTSASFRCSRKSPAVS